MIINLLQNTCALNIVIIIFENNIFKNICVQDSFHIYVIRIIENSLTPVEKCVWDCELPYYLLSLRWLSEYDLYGFHWHFDERDAVNDEKPCHHC